MNNIGKFLGNAYSPSSQPREKTLPCGRGCCWTPFGCGRQKSCACHRPEPYLMIMEEGKK